MNKISHNRKDESIESKVRWYRSLPLSERMELLCSYTDLVLTQNPKLQFKKNAQSVTGRIQILTKA